MARVGAGSASLLSHIAASLPAPIDAAAIFCASHVAAHGGALNTDGDRHDIKHAEYRDDRDSPPSLRRNVMSGRNSAPSRGTPMPALRGGAAHAYRDADGPRIETEVVPERYRRGLTKAPKHAVRSASMGLVRMDYSSSG